MKPGYYVGTHTNNLYIVYPTNVITWFVDEDDQWVLWERFLTDPPSSLEYLGPL